MAYTAPHWPLQAPEENIARYKGRYDTGWDALRAERQARMTAMGILDEQWPITPRDPRVPAWEDVPETERTWYTRAMEVYAAQVDRMDQGIGRIVSALEAAGQLENTLVMFLADNGGCAEVLTAAWRGLFLPKETRDGQPVAIGNDISRMPGPEESYQSYGPAWANASNTPFRLYKHWVHEGGIATPFILHWPARLQDGGGLTSEVGHIIDIMATALDAAGSAYPADYGGHAILPMEGESLLPILDGADLTRRPLFWEHEGNRAVREGRWKLVSTSHGEWELYDMERDRSEMQDLSLDYPARTARMAAMYARWARRAQVLSLDELRAHRQRQASP